MTRLALVLAVLGCIVVIGLANLAWSKQNAEKLCLIGKATKAFDCL